LQFLQLSEAGSNTGTLQMESSDGSMSMPVTLTMEDGQLVAHIPSESQFLTKKVRPFKLATTQPYVLHQTNIVRGTIICLKERV
jgi:hypothetical protein